MQAWHGFPTPVPLPQPSRRRFGRSRSERFHLFRLLVCMHCPHPGVGEVITQMPLLTSRQEDFRFNPLLHTQGTISQEMYVT